ncbi:hypothetical protein D3C87_1522680 [compost metagenome]
MKAVFSLIGLLMFVSGAQAQEVSRLQMFLEVDISTSYTTIFHYEKEGSWVTESNYCYSVALGRSALVYASIAEYDVAPVFKKLKIDQAAFTKKVWQGTEQCIGRKR